MNWSGRLTAADERLAVDVTRRYRANVKAAGGGNRWGLRGDSYATELGGFRAEIFAARVYGVEWVPRPFSERHLPDVANFDVRHSANDRYGLLLHAEDPGDRPHLLVTGTDWLTVRGWAWRDEVVLDRWRRDGPEMRWPCWIMPQGRLHDPDTLPVEVSSW